MRKLIVYIASSIDGYIVLTHHPDDDPAGFMALCLMGSFASLVIATAFAIFEKLLRKAVELKSENELTI